MCIINKTIHAAIYICLCAVLIFAAGNGAAAEEGLCAAIRAVKGSSSCARMVSDHWPASWPVPTGGKGGAEFKVFFFEIPPTQETHFWMSGPRAIAVFDSPDAAAANCRAVNDSAKQRFQRRFGAPAERLDMDTFLRRSDELYAATETIALRYAAKAQPAPKDAEVAERYLKVFELLAEPDFLPHYYRLNPDFWEWLRRLAGRSIPKVPATPHSKN